MADHEVRLALVMNGGVSLAVWMGGVTHEIDLVRRSCRGTPIKEYDATLADRWRSLLHPDGGEHRDLVVDVIAGTSAGGLNGAMLATTIAHDGSLDPEVEPSFFAPAEPVPGPWLREVWCNLGTLRRGRLIPEDVAAATGSILDGDFFLRQAQRIMATLGATTGGGGRGQAPPTVTLFTTASGLGRQGFRATDAAGQEFDVDDHRFLYRLTTDLPWTYRPETMDFAPPPDLLAEFSDPDRLGRAARASASFPAAFAPVNEGPLLNQVGPPRVWPATGGREPSWLIDGGVLDNAPFGPVLDTLARTAVSGKVTRYLAYVVPSGGITRVAQRIADSAVADGPPPWTQAVASGLRFPAEADFRSDVQELERLRVEADAGWSDSQRLFERAVADDDQLERLRVAAEHLQPVYTRGRAAGGVWEAVMVTAAGRLTLLDRDADAPMRAVPEILATGPLWTPPEGAPVRAFPREDTAGGVEWPWGLGPAERVLRTILRTLRGRLAGETDATTRAELGAALALVSASVRRVLAVRRAVGARLAAEFPVVSGSVGAGVPLERTPAEVAAAINRVYADLRVQQVLGRELAAARGALPAGEQLLEAALAVEVVSRCTSSRMPDQRSVPFSFVRLGPDVALPVLPPEHQEVARRLGDHILFGTQVGHFGAFGAEQMRRWDWLLGRLHAVAHLGMLLHGSGAPTGDGSEGRTTESAVAWVRETQAAVLAAEGWTLEQVIAQVDDLAEAYDRSSLAYGAARMIDGMNDADRRAGNHPDQYATREAGERALAIAPGLGRTPGRWIQAALGLREPAGVGAAERTARWFAAPVREALWQRLVGKGAQSDPPRGLVVGLLTPVPWLLVALGGAVAVVVAAILAGGRPGVGVALACLGGAALLLGAVGLGLALAATRVRARIGRLFRGKLGTWLPDSGPPEG
ncbi:hypothetical protein E8D34_17745 [Nocardioides sp. GY 10113]|uniref:DUF3376 domain-containing protein n=1 Tax=Nocardioides sp. GY 10113 TaxID=2569761 RepID=UPI0010A81356|nr:DUF3376 domain-containing protein [Nocardioides sp. GY 10113]TIC81525.1 hypothetical protein E8D34_17745 [Nocardioides sp. GY 10113]